MDAMDVLGALLGKKAGSGSSGGNILKDILGGGRSRSQPPAQSPPRQHPQARPPRTIGEAAKSLEELLNVSNEHHQQRRRNPASTQRSPNPQPTPQSQQRTGTQWAPQEAAMNEQSKILVRAMVNAAKSDGQVNKQEQDKILQQLDHVSQEEINFLRAEFDKPLDVRDFTWSVPQGMEEQVYTISLIAIDLDEQKEANYLADLAHGLRLDTARCNEIHRNFGAPIIFKS